MDFPTIVYCSPGPHRAHGGASYAYMGVDDAAAYKAALADGWHATVIEALGATVLVEAAKDLAEAADEVSSTTRDELEAMARKLGVPFNKRTSDETLLARLGEATAEAA